MIATVGHIAREVLMTALDGEVILPGIREIRDDETIQCFVDRSPDELDRQIRINNGHGVTFGNSQRDGRLFRHDAIMVTIRHEEEDLGNDVANRVYKALTGVTPRDVEFDDVLYHLQSIYVTSSLLPLGEEVGKKRFLWSFNARVAMQYQDPTPVE